MHWPGPHGKHVNVIDYKYSYMHVTSFRFIVATFQLFLRTVIYP